MKKKNIPHTTSPTSKKLLRNKLKHLFKTSPLETEDLLVNFGLFTRSSTFAKQLFLYEIYKNILNIPGNIHVYGVWWGQDLALLYNLREVLEPHNVNRKVIGFDTFDGYRSMSKFDKKSDVINKNNYNTGQKYLDYLHKIMTYHEAENSIGNIKKFEIIKGDLTSTIKEYGKRNKHEIVALAYLDLAIYKPTLAVLSYLEKNLVKGGYIIMDQLNNNKYPGETLALKESKLFNNCEFRNSKFLPDRTILKKIK